MSPPAGAPLGPALGERGLHDRSLEILGRQRAARGRDRMTNVAAVAIAPEAEQRGDVGIDGVELKLDTVDPDIPALLGFRRDRDGGDIRHAVAAARGALTAEDLEAAIVKAALAKGWAERRP